VTTGEPKRTLDRTGAILDAAPVAAAYFVVAWVFGIAALKAGFPLWLPVAMCMFVYAGASQFSALALLAAQASAPTIVLATLLINARHALMSIYMARALIPLGLTVRQRWAYGLGLTDESFAVHSARLTRDEIRSGDELIVFNVTCHVAWIAGALVGGLCAGAFSHIARLRLDFALSAMMVYVLVSLCDTRRKLVSVAVAAGVMLLLKSRGGSAADLFIAAFAGCGVGTCLKTRA
jgi:4-azaleucine resistance transporter AzlC